MANKRYPASNIANSAVQLSRARKSTSGTISKGQVVYSTGYDIVNDIYIVELANASSASTMPSVGIAYESFTDVDSGAIILSGDLSGVDTSGFLINQEVFVSGITSGGLTNIRPTTSHVEKIGIVVKSDSTTGIIQVYNYGTDDSPLSDASPIDVTKSIAVAGTSTDAARQDHKHSISTGAPSSTGTSNTEGSATSLARSDHVHNTILSASIDEFSTTITTTSANFVLMPGMTHTPGLGTYLVTFSGDLSHSSGSATIDTTIYINAIEVSASRRNFLRGSSQGDVKSSFICQAIATISNGQTIEGRWRTSTSTASCYHAQLVILKIG